MQIEGTKLVFFMDFSLLDFVKFAFQNASNCTDFSLEFQNLSGGGVGRGHAPRPW